MMQGCWRFEALDQQRAVGGFIVPGAASASGAAQSQPAYGTTGLPAARRMPRVHPREEQRRGKAGGTMTCGRLLLAARRAGPCGRRVALSVIFPTPDFLLPDMTTACSLVYFHRRDTGCSCSWFSAVLPLR